MKHETKHFKLMKAYNNNVLISDINLKDKFTEFENSKLNESEILLYEVTMGIQNFGDRL